MPAPSPEAQDVPIPFPPSRFGDPESVQYAVTDLYSAARVGAVLQRQARAALIAQAALADLANTTTLTLTVSAGYVQAEVQSIVTKLNEVIAKQNQIIAAVNAIKSAASSNIVSISPDPDEE